MWRGEQRFAFAEQYVPGVDRKAWRGPFGLRYQSSGTWDSDVGRGLGSWTAGLLQTISPSS